MTDVLDDTEDLTLLDLNIIYSEIFKEILRALEDGDIEYLKGMLEIIIGALDIGIKMMKEIEGWNFEM